MQPIVTALLATLAGLSVAPIYLFPVSLTLAVFVAVFLTAFLPGKPALKRHIAVVLFCLLISNSLYFLHAQPQHFSTTIALGQLSRKVIIEGEVWSFHWLEDERGRIDVLVDSVLYKGEQMLKAESCSVRLYVEKAESAHFPGDRIRFASRLRQPRLFGTPGEFDWPRYLRSQRVDLTAWVKDGSRIETIVAGSDSFKRRISLWRSRIAASLKSELPSLRAQLTRALLLGERRVLNDSVRETLSASGVSHLFAISGLHLGLIGLLSYRVLLELYRRLPVLIKWQPPQRVLPLIIVPLLFVYLLLTGDAVSTRRAFALATLGAIFLIWRYFTNPLVLLASLACLSLWINPLLLWQAGWQLSFAGAAAILLCQPWWAHENISRCPTCFRYPLQLLLVSGAATLATMPMVLMNFHMIAPVSIFANLVCVPIVTLIALPVGLIGLLAFPIEPGLAGGLFAFCGLLLEWLVSICEWMTRLPGLDAQHIFLGRLQHLAVGIVALAVLVQVRVSSLTSRCVVFGVSCMVAAVLWWGAIAAEDHLSLTMISVGQGEAILVRNRAGQSLLVDGGGLYSDRFDVGERLLAPAFGELGVDSFDAVLLTHDHPDHRKGLIYVLEHFPVAHFYSGHSLAEIHSDLSAVLMEKEIPFSVVGQGWSGLQFWKDGELLVFNGDAPGLRENDLSLALYLRIGEEDGFLLTGDLEKAGVTSLIKAGIPGPVSLLKLPHHGSRYSLTDRLIDQLHPVVAMVSVGYQNRYHLPARDVVEHLEKKGIPLLRTDKDGTVKAVYQQNRWQTACWDRGLFR